MFADRKIVAHEADGETPVVQADIGPTGEYEVNLRPGEYVIDINHLGVDSADGFPQDVAIRSGQTTVLDASIDTGIR